MGYIEIVNSRRGDIGLSQYGDSLYGMAHYGGYDIANKGYIEVVNDRTKGYLNIVNERGG